ncbi:MAG: hypothetical protein IPI66_02935 [Chitinophagaceae bacterium]|nr:hypothetical protein [Chitinophagaceae bacterium]MBL0055138.1 hypothetical protein [Chitinophagaceae bacterium]
MKKLLFISTLLFSFFALFSSCSKSDPGVINPTNTSAILVQSNWRITYYSDNGTEGTSDFNGFKFTFSANGTVSAANDILAIPGNWSSYSDDSRNNLLLNFSNILPVIATLNHDWHIIEKTTIKIRLEDVSGGGGGTDYLTLERN